MNNRVILHIDMNAYFASVAVVLHPEYKGKPLIVAGTGKRGIVSTASYEARKYGIHSAMPTYQAKQLCPDVIICNPGFGVYEKYTYLFVQIIKRYSKIIEMASIDECYVDMTEALKGVKEPLKVIQNIQYSILNELQLPCSIGVAPNKFLAKMASDMKKPLGITVLRKADVKKMLWPLDIGDMFGIGKKSQPRLREAGINTIGDLAQCEDYDLLRSLLGNSAEHFKKWANGIDYSPVLVESDDLKSVGHSRTFEHDTCDIVEIYQMFQKLSIMVANRAKDLNLVGTSIQMTIKYSDFNVINRTKRLGLETNDPVTIYENAIALFEQSFTGNNLRLVGVSLQNTKKVDEYHHQLTIFDSFEPQVEQEKDKIKKLIANLNKELGENLLKTARDIKKY